jgi:hypothetical protein
MDNGAFTGTSAEVRKAYDNLRHIFNPYCFDVQQPTTNVFDLQNDIDQEKGDTTPNCVKLLGLTWDRETDCLLANKISLNESARTKRQLLQTIASQYDPFNFQGPCLNRARVFIHSLQVREDIDWDTVLTDELQREWRNISRQANKGPAVAVSRFVGAREDDYELIAFTDASKTMYAAVVYIKSQSFDKVLFLPGKNKIVNRQLELKTVPSLELQAITLGVEVLFDLREELSGPKGILPLCIVKLRIFTDSSIALHWLNAQTQKFAKMQKQSVFVQN